MEINREIRKATGSEDVGGPSRSMVVVRTEVLWHIAVPTQTTVLKGSFLMNF